jgi:hypothetical protein
MRNDQFTYIQAAICVCIFAVVIFFIITQEKLDQIITLLEVMAK